MKKIIIAGENIAYLPNDKIRIKFGKKGEGILDAKEYDANDLKESDIEAIRKDPKKAKDFTKDLKTVEVPTVDKPNKKL